jgi:hypothetical protein
MTIILSKTMITTSIGPTGGTHCSIDDSTILETMMVAKLVLKLKCSFEETKEEDL